MQQSIRGIVLDFRRYGAFSWREIMHLGITAFIFGFILSFTKWGVGDEFRASAGVYFWALYFLLSFIPLLVMQFGHRIMAVHLGYVPEFIQWKIGLALNVIFTFATNGLFWFLSPGGFEIKRHEGLQLGKFRIGSVYRDKSYIAFFGLFTLVLYMIFVKVLPLSIAARTEAISIAAAIGLWSLFPLDLIMKIIKHDTPNSNGTILIFGSRGFCAFAVVFFAASVGIIAFSSRFLSDVLGVIVALILAIVAYLLWILFFDPKKLWSNK